MPWREEATPRMPDPIYPLTYTADGEIEACQICGEDADEEMGEFYIPTEIRPASVPTTIVAHGGCGEDHDLPLA